MYSTKATIAKLISRHKGGLAGSIYIPTHPDSSPSNMSADRTRFKNALQHIRRQDNYDEAILGDTMKKLETLQEDMTFWSYQDQGLAVLFSSDELECIKLPFEVTEAEYLTDHFVVSPLLIMEALDTSFFVLDVNLTAPRLLKGTRGELHEVIKDDMLGTLDDEVGKDEYQKQLQHQRSGGGAYHGHTEDDVVDDETRRYLKKLAAVVDSFMLEKRVPLLLAGTNNRTDAIRKELSYPVVLDRAHSGNVERLSKSDLYDAAVPLIQEHLVDGLSQTIHRLQEASPQFVAIGAEEIMAIIKQEAGGRIEYLFLPIYRMTRDGVWAGDNRSLVLELPEDIESIEPLVAAVSEQGGSIVPVEIDAHEGLDQPKALCRF